MTRTAMPTAQKAYGLVEIALKAVESKEPHGEFEAVLSAPTKDRDGEVVAARAFEPLPPRIPIDIDHAMSVRSTVGSGVPFYDGDILRIRGTFASTQLGQEVRTLVTEGHITKMSVAFMGPKREVKDGVPYVVSAELLNAAIVAIPSNREADITAAKAALKVGARNNSKDGERLQEIHDLAVLNGAQCSAAKSAQPPAPQTEDPPSATPGDADPDEKAAAPAAAVRPASSAVSVLLLRAQADELVTLLA